ncbi:uncharacterized protein LAESUDRAFT_643152 [Laetiporus sulphureus 93-53]|uniref:Large ribosomal subunit protein mL49 n=1 Tax=Laetiporus sulphureus 93-53 TaxID=1314785 RepID=A0A165H9C8_9APHY|nr:uncharacterized protein LAESUDRAFT_643152 [Laetiporus sulphureus 93-53]KZT11423.1 hypothetical protein LAESUDRAFT_643152 [Laetiporus sulphureus 93-53]
MLRRAAVVAARQVPSLPYDVPRNTRGSMPVFTDIRNAGTRHLTLIRNVQGDLAALAKDLATTLHPPGSPEAKRMKTTIIRSQHIVLSGGLWKTKVMRWLAERGF